PSNRGRVIVELDARLNGLPILDFPEAAIAQKHRGGDRGLADARVRAGYEETAKHILAALSAKRRRVFSSNPTFTDTRRRAVPAGTAGGRMARTSKPSR